MSIYYAAKGLRGKPYHSDIINKDLFAFFQKRASNYYGSVQNFSHIL